MDPLAHDSVEWLAAAILVIGGGVFVALAARARRGRLAAATLGPGGGTSPRLAAADDVAAPSIRRSLDVMLAGLSAGAAVIHLVAAPSHFAEIGDLAAGFLISAAFQSLWARWCLAGPSRRAVAIGILGNLAIVAAWAWTRTVGLPVGELAGTAEPIGFPDAASVAFELILVAGLLVRRRSPDVAPARHAVARTLASIAVVPVIGLVVVLTSLATVAIASGLEHGAPDAHGAVHVAGH